jgi:beta-glucosidase
MRSAGFLVPESSQEFRNSLPPARIPAKKVIYLTKSVYSVFFSYRMATPMTQHLKMNLALLPAFVLLGTLFCAAPALTAQPPSAAGPSANSPWMNTSLSPDQRADLVLKQLTLEEKIALLHGTGMPFFGPQSPETKDSNGGAGYVPGISRLGIPGIQMADAAYGVTHSADHGRYSTALPSDLAGAATWDPEGAYAYGALIGRELRAQGYSMSLGGGVNLAREPRDGRTFEYMGEDPILAGTMVGNVMKGLQAQHIIGDIKHYAINDQESGRNAVNANISKRAMRESDLLAFEIGLRISDAQAVMCSYNRVNGDYACENKYLLTDVLKRDFKFPGFVVSDWTGTHSAEKSSAAGLDNEEPFADFYGETLLAAVRAGKVPLSQIDDHAHRMLRAEFASGLVDDPVKPSVVDAGRGLQISQHLAESSIVLLRNQDAILPLDPAKLHRIAVIGAHADAGILSGGGSAQVDPPGGNAVQYPSAKGLLAQNPTWFKDSPIAALIAEAHSVKGQNLTFTYDSGESPANAALEAKNADIAIVFAQRYESEDHDLPTLALPDHQDALIEQVAAANPHTIVVLENGSPVLMPWVDQVAGILESWYPGSRGAEAIANILFGDVNPSAKLPLTFPRSDADLPHPTIIHPPPGSSVDFSDPDILTKVRDGLPAFQVYYDEGLKVGYKWYDAEKKPVLFPFGFGLSYTTYAYSGLKIDPPASPDRITTVTFTVRNIGQRPGSEIAEVYAAFPASANEPPKRLVGWSKVALDAGEAKQVTVTVIPEYLSVFDESKDAMQLVPGAYTIRVGGSSHDLPLEQTVTLP